MNTRRQFLRFLAGSPLFAEAWAQQQAAAPASAADVLAVMDFEELAHRALPPAHWGYMTSGVDDNATRDANMAGYKRIQLRPQRLVDVSKVDLRINLFGTEWESPIFLCPLGGQKMFNPDGEVATARAREVEERRCKFSRPRPRRRCEEVAQALGRPPWYQLYMPAKWEDTEKLVHRVEEAGCPVMAWTIDSGRPKYGDGDSLGANRYARLLELSCRRSHGGSGTARPGRAPMFDGLSGTAINPSVGDLGTCRSAEEADQDEAAAEGCRDPRRRKAGPRAWRRRHHRLESRRPRHRRFAPDHRKPARGDRRRRHPDSGAGRRRCPTWHGCL